MRNRYRQMGWISLLGGLLCSTACSKADRDELAGDTSMRLVLSVAEDAGTRSRASITFAGTDAERKVTYITLLDPLENKVFSPLSSAPTAVDLNDKFWADGNVYKTSIWNSKGGTRAMALMLNGRSGTADTDIYGMVSGGLSGGLQADAVIGTTASASDYATKVNANLGGLISPSGMLMTSKLESKTVEENVSKQQAWNGVKNQIAFDLVRVAAKGIVYRSSNTDFTTQHPTTREVLGTIKATTMTFAAVNGATVTYLYPNQTNAVIHTQSYADTDAEAKTLNLVRLGNLGSGATNYAAKAVSLQTANDVNTLAASSGCYFMENTCNDYGAAFALHGFNRYAYAKVYVDFRPATVFNGASLPADGTFYYGSRQGRFYASRDVALEDGNANTDIYKYTGGRMAYRALWNRVEDTAHNVTNADTHRNTIYILHLTGFEGLGMPWDPADPNDPNLPKSPEDDGTDPPGSDPNVNPLNGTYMRVKASVQKWRAVKRDTSLGIGMDN